jgi:hypothetical protein
MDRQEEQEQHDQARHPEHPDEVTRTVGPERAQLALPDRDSPMRHMGSASMPTDKDGKGRRYYHYFHDQLSLS